MSSRNMDRTTGLPKDGPDVKDGGSAEAAVAAAAAAVPPTPGPPAGAGGASSLLNFARPTQWVPLPSKGQYYPQGHPWHNKEQVEIKFMTAKEEDILASRSLLQKGIAIDRMLQSVFVDRVDTKSLLVGDKNALMVAARVTGYGEKYPVSYKCPHCGTQAELEFDLDSFENKTADEDWCQKHNVRMNSNGYYITLPKTNVVANIRFLTGLDEEKLDKLASNKKKAKLGESRMIDQFRLMIVDLNGETDRATISQFCENMPAGDSRVLRKSFMEIRPDLDTSFNFVCQECYQESEGDMPITAQFFWPDD